MQCNVQMIELVYRLGSSFLLESRYILVVISRLPSNILADRRPSNDSQKYNDFALVPNRTAVDRRQFDFATFWGTPGSQIGPNCSLYRELV